MLKRFNRYNNILFPRRFFFLLYRLSHIRNNTNHLWFFRTFGSRVLRTKFVRFLFYTVIVLPRFRIYYRYYINIFIFVYPAKNSKTKKLIISFKVWQKSNTVWITYSSCRLLNCQRSRSLHYYYDYSTIVEFPYESESIKTKNIHNNSVKFNLFQHIEIIKLCVYNFFLFIYIKKDWEKSINPVLSNVRYDFRFKRKKMKSELRLDFGFSFDSTIPDTHSYQS